MTTDEFSHTLRGLETKVAILNKDVEKLDKDIGKVADISRQALKDNKEASENAISELRSEFKEIKKAFDQITTTISRIQHIALGVAIMYLAQLIGFDSVLKKILGV